MGLGLRHFTKSMSKQPNIHLKSFEREESTPRGVLKSKGLRMYQTKSKRCLGIDPGIGNTGWAIVGRTARGKFSVLDAGVITTPKTESEAKRVLLIYDEVSELLIENPPNLLAVEQVFYNRNISSCITTAGVVYICLLAAEQIGIECEQITPQQAKAAATGRGTASKKDVAHMVHRLTGAKLANTHTADAAAVAIAGLLQPPHSIALSLP